MCSSSRQDNYPLRENCPLEDLHPEIKLNHHNCPLEHFLPVSYIEVHPTTRSRKFLFGKIATRKIASLLQMKIPPFPWISLLFLMENLALLFFFFYNSAIYDIRDSKLWKIYGRSKYCTLTFIRSKRWFSIVLIWTDFGWNWKMRRY